MKRVVLFLFACAMSSLLMADCVDGVRQPSAAELQYLEKTYQKLLAALPAAPAGWEMTPPPAAPLRPSLCTGSPQGAFAITAAATYRWSKGPSYGDLPEAQEIGKLEAEMSQLKRLPPDVSKQRSDKMTACNEFRKAALEAEKAGNKAETSRLFAERNACLEKAEQVAKDYLASIAPRLAPLQARRDEMHKKVAGYSNEVRLAVTLNEAYPQRPSPDETVLLFGVEKLPRSTGLKVHNVRLLARGFSERRDAVLAALDKAKLQALIQ